MANSRGALRRLAPYVLGAAGLVMLLLVARSFIGSSGFAYDFDAYDGAARRIAAGLPLYPPGIAEAYNSGAYAGLYLYPPPLAAALVPLTALGPQDAALAWLWLRLIALVAGVALLPVSRLARGAVLAIASISFPVWYDLNLGNLSILLFALSAVIWRFRTSAIGSIGLAVAGMLRYPFALVGLGFVSQRAWRMVALTIATGLALGAATLPLVGVGGWTDYVAALRALDDVSSGPHNLSLATTAAALGLPGPAGLWVAAGMAAALGVTVVAALRRDRETSVVVSLAATTLFFPFFHPHYLVQLLIPAAFLAGRGQWWSLALPLLGWLPGEALPVAALAGAVAPLAARGLARVSAGDGLLGGGAEYGRDPRRP
jgi:hypothetical protein